MITVIKAILLSALFLGSFSLAAADTRGRSGGEKTYIVSFSCPMTEYTMTLSMHKKVEQVRIAHKDGAIFDVTAETRAHLKKVLSADGIGSVCVTDYPSFNVMFTNSPGSDTSSKQYIQYSFDTQTREYAVTSRID